jgi:hypothetical protein
MRKPSRSATLGSPIDHLAASAVVSNPLSIRACGLTRMGPGRTAFRRIRLHAAATSPHESSSRQRTEQQFCRLSGETGDATSSLL